jgi:hypothetical protein
VKSLRIMLRLLPTQQLRNQKSRCCLFFLKENRSVQLESWQTGFYSTR